MLATCEAYGKMALHKEGRKEVQGSQLSVQLRLYCTGYQVALFQQSQRILSQ